LGPDDTSLRTESELVPVTFLDLDSDVEEHGRFMLGHNPATGV
jgi:hypothetical protein